jgi:polynucleotide 5'-hydroxyl-kinase GRC3/NOL9
LVVVVPAEWREAVRRAARAGVTMVVGESDTGKTTLVTTIANSLRARRLAVAVIDADLGQSEIGPPTTIGLGRVRRRLGRLADADVVALYFVGVTSPARHLLRVVVGTRRMLDRARRGQFRRIVIDTSGLISGPLGRALKQAKIEVMDPDLVICLERAGECGHIVAAYAGATRPVVMRVPAGTAARPRSQEDRRRHRQRRLDDYFAPARRITLSLSRVCVTDSGGAVVVPGANASLAEGTLIGLLDTTRATLGLGIVRGIDAGALHVDTPIAEARVAALVIGRESYPA